jgi:indolepyruvate ferredoxin oxidoreductase, alpha subunit
MENICLNAPGTEVLLMGNEAVARGALEAGIGVATAYPGSPSSEVLATLAEVAKKMNIHAEWSVNEKVATEVAAGASFAGIRSISVMKQNGMNVAADFLVNLNMTGIGTGGMVIFVSDDPSSKSSNNEEDSRPITKWLDMPLLEASSAQEAKEMIKWAFEVSEAINLVTIVRAVTRISYTKSNVVLDELPQEGHPKAYFPYLWDMDHPTKSKLTSGPFGTLHEPLHKKMEKARDIFETSRFNQYKGPENPELLMITCGACTSYSIEAVEALKLENRVGILKLGTTWPLPEKLIAKHLSRTEKVLFVEEIDPFVERSVMELTAALLPTTSHLKFYGKRSGHLAPFNEQDTDRVIEALVKILEENYRPRDFGYDRAAKEASQIVPPRPINFCAGCPHRATFWAIKKALQLDGRHGFVCGDIGCYSLGIVDGGFFQCRTMHAMGSGAGVANGLGNLKQFGFDQPVVAICGDSTFYHAVIPAVVNSVYNNANLTLVILDNGGTAMTGFQPHPGTGELATGDQAKVIDMEALCRAIGADVKVCDPFNLQNTVETLLQLMKEESGTKVVIMRHSCELIRAKKEKKKPYKVSVDQERCAGNTCGCDRLCSRVFQCPGVIWDEKRGQAVIDEALCVGCGLCVDVCPEHALTKEAIG